MTESEWLACCEPETMLLHLRGRASARKLRLFAVACCRRIGPLLADPRCQAAVEAAERYAEGRVGPEELRLAQDAAGQAAEEVNEAVLLGPGGNGPAADAAVAAAADPLLPHRVASAASTARVCDGFHCLDDLLTAKNEEKNAQCDLLRCLFGNPFRPVATSPPWLSGEGRTVRALAQAIYDECRFSDLPILADALEDAGCADEWVLEHCRSGREHVRDCWALGWVLGES